ncbi:MAG: hypothetical protein JWQ02_3829 [Capsulimonas sp.]|nr:hypothetical protein [Capsulimonas sp.]
MERLPQNNERIEKYLNEVAWGLQYMPTEVAAETLDELRQHLYALASQLRNDGASDEAAVTAALKKFGPGHRVGVQLGTESIHEFMSGLSGKPLPQPKWMDNLRLVVSTASLLPSTFGTSEHWILWPFAACVAGAVFCGVLESFDRPHPVNETQMLEFVARSETSLVKRRWVSAFAGRLLFAHVMRSAQRRRMMLRLGNAYNPLRELDWRFFTGTAIGGAASWMIPDTHWTHALKPLLLWIAIWIPTSTVTSVIMRAARNRLAQRA